MASRKVVVGEASGVRASRALDAGGESGVDSTYAAGSDPVEILLAALSEDPEPLSR